METRYAIVGCGAVGGYYGGCLQRAGLEVHYLARGDAAVMQSRGLQVESPRGDFTLPRVNAYSSPGDLPPCDVAVVALKTTANRHLADILPRVLRPGGTVLLLQNGLGEEARVARIPGVGAVVGGLCFVCLNKIGPGRVRHLEHGAITLAEFREGDGPAGVTDPLRRLAQDLGRTGIPIHVEADLLLARWRKLVWNIPFNGLTTVTGLDTRALLASPGGATRVRAIMEEVRLAAAGCGRDIPAEFLDRMIAQTRETVAYSPSMKLDFEAGRELELESMYAEPLRRASAAGVAMPETGRLYRELGALGPATDSRDQG